MSRLVELASLTLLAGISAVAAARHRNLSPSQVVLSFPLGVAVYLVSEGRSWTSNFSR